MLSQNSYVKMTETLEERRSLEMQGRKLEETVY